jgi:hypothetical protein
LDTDRPIRHDRVEACPIERTGHALVVLDAAEPGSWGCQTIPFGKCSDQLLAFGDNGRTETQGVLRGGGGIEVHVVVMQSGEHTTPARFDGSVRGPDLNVGTDLGDATL